MKAKMTWFGAVLGVFLSLAGSARATVTIQDIQVSNTSPNPGDNIAVTVTFCDSTEWNTSFLMAAIHPSSTGASILSCPGADQTVVVSTAGVNVPLTGYTSGWDAGNNAGTAGCPARQVVWDPITVPDTLPGGETVLAVCGRTDWVDCGGQPGDSCMAVTLNIPLPPADFSVSQNTPGPSTVPAGLVMFSIPYTAVNTNNFMVFATVPANCTLVDTSVGALTGGVAAGSPVTWVIGNVTQRVSGEVWFVCTVNPLTPIGTVISHQASASSDEVGTRTSNETTVTVGGGTSILKSQSASVLNAGESVTYSIAWGAVGDAFQLLDHYNQAVGISDAGYDGTAYTIVPNGGQDGSWSFIDPGSGDLYLSANGNGAFPVLLRSSGDAACESPYTVQGDLYVDPGNTPDLDAHLVIRHDGLSVSSHNYMVGISGDANPGHLFLQKNVGGTVTWPASSNSTVVSTGQWYTVKVRVEPGPAAASVTINAKVWARGSGEPGSWGFTYVDSTPPSCTGAQYVGWQAARNADRYDNLMVYGPTELLNASITDTVPTGVTYGGSDNGGSLTGGIVTWNFSQPVAVTNATYSWWGTADACPATVVNRAALGADNAAVTESNAVTLTVDCLLTPTSTWTPTPTGTPTPTIPIVTCVCDLPADASAAALWTMNEGAGTVVSDVTGHGYTGMLYEGSGCAPPLVPGGATWDTGHSCGGLRFDGVDDYLDTGFRFDLPTSGSFTVEYWIRPEGNTGYVMASGTGIGTPNKTGLNFGIQPSGSDLRMYFSARLREGESLTEDFESIETFATGQWYYVAWVWENKEVRLYVNGVQRTLDEALFPYDGTFLNEANQYIGAVNDYNNAICATSLVTSHYRGMVDDVRISYAARSASGIADHFACGMTPTPTPTWTPTWSPTAIDTPTPRPTSTPDNDLHIWPNPYDPREAFGGVLKVSVLPEGAVVDIYNISGEKVRELAEKNRRVEWNGRNEEGNPVSTGTYYFIVKAGTRILRVEKVIVVMP